MDYPSSISEIQECVRSQPRVVTRGGGTKPALYFGSEASTLEMTHLQGLIEYQPEEFTFTAWAGSRLTDVEQALTEHGQFLPFDPVLVERGSTLGGMVASGLSGSGRYRFGGLRDFVLGLKFVDGLGNLVRSGGKVVKNAAGFDLSKFMVGSLGQYGVLVELTFKVFPRPAAYATLKAEYASLANALEVCSRLADLPLELFALDVAPNDKGCTLLIRLGGQPEILVGRMQRLNAILEGANVKAREYQEVAGASEAEIWRIAREFLWVEPDQTLVKVPLTPRRIAALDEQLTALDALRRYCVGGSLAWVAWPGPLSKLDDILAGQGLSGLAIIGTVDSPLIGLRTGDEFARRVKKALDPHGKF